MKIIKILLLPLILIALYSCQNTVDALQGKKRSDKSDEFLVEKKSPLTLPPDFNELPQPKDNEQITLNTENQSSVKKILNIESNQTSANTSKNRSIEKSIIEKINN